jgi:hypothetical protein
VRSQCRVNLFRGFTLHAGDHVAVDPQSRRDIRMPKGFLYDLHMCTEPQVQRRKAVTQIMQSYLAEPEAAAQAAKLLGDAARAQRPAERVAAHQIVILPIARHARPLFALLYAVTPQDPTANSGSEIDRRELSVFASLKRSGP